MELKKFRIHLNICNEISLVETFQRYENGRRKIYIIRLFELSVKLNIKNNETCTV